MTRKEKKIIDDFHNLYYDSKKTWRDTFYLGIQTYKLPLDLWVYQEILYKTKPDFIIESGTYKGGSALYMAHLCDAVKKGVVITIDDLSYKQKIDKKIVNHPRIKFIKGSSVDEKTISQIKKIVKRGRRVMVILDSDHKKDHVYKELEIYSQFVSKGNYLILEDTNINGNPVYKKFGLGPMEALQKFLRNNKKFKSDKKMEKLLVTFNPKGYLLKL